MKPISAYTATARAGLDTGTLIAERQVAGYSLQVIFAVNSLWVVAEWPNGGRVAFRVALALNDALEISRKEEQGDTITIMMKGLTGKYKAVLNFPDVAKPIFRYTTSVTPAFDMLVPYMPADIMPLFKDGEVQNSAGTVHAAQAGTRSGQLHFSINNPKVGSVFYFQNLTALADYCQVTETSAGDVVGGEWPEIGFKLPATDKGKPLPAGKEFIISDAFVMAEEQIPEDNYQITRQYLNCLAEIYLLIPKPETEYRDWLSIVHQGLDDLNTHKGCWKYADGRSYLNAYVSDYESPPEVMVQLAVLMPLIEHDSWSGEDHHPVIETLKQGIRNFYDEQLETIVRWLPAWQSRLDWSEEQKRPDVMDSWYLHHPLMNLSRLALEGDKDAEELFLKSVDYAVRVAHHFNYEWPVFYKMTTLEVLKEETKEGAGGEKDVAGAYAHVMIQAWQLTGEKRYLNEAVRAARTLDGMGFDIFYQANNTAFSAGVLLRLYKETNDEMFLNLSYVCIAAILKNVQLWECNYGYGRFTANFFAIYPLKDAPYTAAYEEQEVFSAIHNYLNEADGINILPSVRLLLAELVRYGVNRLVYYYPAMLPQEMLAEKKDVKTGEIDPNLWIALEDLQDGWNKSGQVGQEVYGAGIAFGIVPRQYFKVKDAGFTIFTDYPATNFRQRKNTVHFFVKGDERLTCKIIIIPEDEYKSRIVTVSTGNGRKKEFIKPAQAANKQGYTEYIVNGNSKVSFAW